jgi:hypothetical protein
MKAFAVSLGAASLFLLSGAALAEQELSASQMDSVTAAGLSNGVAIATAFGGTVATSSDVAVVNAPYSFLDVQAGGLYGVSSTVNTNAGAAADGGLIAGASTVGNASGNVTTQTTSGTTSEGEESLIVLNPTLANAQNGNAAIPFGFVTNASASNTSIASSLGAPASASSFVQAGAAVSF